MQEALLLLPDFVLIVLGWAIARFTALGRPVWDSVERLVYYVLFPALLFHATVRSPMSLRDALPLAGCTWAVVATGVALAFAAGRLRVDPLLHASGAQTAFRMNSYVALALADRLGAAQAAAAPGTGGSSAALAGMALMIAVAVPVCNVAAVWPLARHGGQPILRELARNPLLLATASGLLCNAVGLQLPALLAASMARVGSAAVPLGLMAVGAALTVGALRESPKLAAALMAIRHAVLPAVGLALALALGLPRLQALLVVAFSALPTATSAYVLAVRMGGNGPFVAGLVTLSTLLAMVGLPVTLALAAIWLPP